MTDTHVPTYTEYSITDVGDLARLQAVYSVRDKRGLTVGFDSKWGEVEIQSGGVAWVLEFKDRDTAILHPAGSFDAVYLMELDPAFAESLRKTVIAQSGDSEVQFYRAVDASTVLSD